MKEQYRCKRVVDGNGNKPRAVTRIMPLFYSNLDIELDMIPFHLVAEGDSAVISFSSFSDAFAMLKKMKVLAKHENGKIGKYKELLLSTGITVYLQNRHFGMFGPKAGTIIPKLIGLLSGLGKR